MSDMFNNYPQPDGYVPNNTECTCCCCDEPATIIINGTNTHTFKLNFLVSEMCESFEVIYKSGLNDIITISSLNLGAPIEISEEDEQTSIVITISPSYTQMFNKARDAYVQMKLYMKDKTVVYGDLNKLTIIETLNNDTNLTSYATKADVDIEKNERETADNYIVKKVDDEVIRAIDKETDLEEKIAKIDLTSYATKADVEEETERAKQVEELINTDLHTNYTDLVNEQVITGKKLFRTGDTTDSNIVFYDDATVFEKKAEFIEYAIANYDVFSSTENRILTTKQYVDSSLLNVGKITTIFSGDQNGIALSLIKDYDLLVIRGYKEKVASPNKSTFILTKYDINNPTEWSAKLVANEWEYTLRLSSNSTTLFFYSTIDYSSSTIFKLTDVIGIKGV